MCLKTSLTLGISTKIRSKSVDWMTIELIYLTNRWLFNSRYIFLLQENGIDLPFGKVSKSYQSYAIQSPNVLLIHTVYLCFSRRFTNKVLPLVPSGNFLPKSEVTVHIRRHSTGLMRRQGRVTSQEPTPGGLIIIKRVALPSFRHYFALCLDIFFSLIMWPSADSIRRQAL